MIKEKKINTTISSNTFNHYKKLGYYVKKGNIISVNIEHLTKSSHVLITGICDYCGSELKMMFKTYKIRTEKSGKYSCKKCCYDVMKISLKEKYGVENISHLPKIKEKIRIKAINNSKLRSIKRIKTNLKRYGVKNTFQSKILMKDSQIKVKKTQIKTVDG